LIWPHLLGEKHQCRRKKCVPALDHLFLRQRRAIKVSHLNVAEHVDLHHKEVVIQRRCDLWHGKHLFMHFGAIDAPALLDDDHQTFTFGVRLFKIFAQVLKGLAHPIGLVKPVIAQCCGKHGERDDDCCRM
jgi:hypothetical protein